MNYTTESRYPSLASGTIVTGTNLRGLILSASGSLQLWYERHRQRRHLARLDDRLLRDIGIDRATAELEISKPFWRP
jgi:uncharacterized protein YjiS (DUF1127 family)